MTIPAFAAKINTSNLLAVHTSQSQTKTTKRQNGQATTKRRRFFKMFNRQRLIVAFFV